MGTKKKNNGNGKAAAAQLHMSFIQPAPTLQSMGDGTFKLIPSKPIAELTPRQFAAAVGISSVRSVYDLIERGVIKSVRRPTQRRIKIAADEAERYRLKTYDPEFWEGNNGRV